MYAGRDIPNEYKNAYSIRPQTLDSTTNGVAVDFQDCGPEVVSVLTVGAVSGTNATCDVKLQESADNSSWSDVSSATHTQVTAANQHEVIQTGIRSKRYVRAKATLAADDTPNFDTCVTLHSPKISY